MVKHRYDSWGNLARDWHRHDGAADGSTPQVNYGYGALARLTGVRYPSTSTGWTIGYSYGTSGEMDDRLSRVAAITDGSTTRYADYTYLGAGRRGRS